MGSHLDVDDSSLGELAHHHLALPHRPWPIVAAVGEHKLGIGVFVIDDEAGRDHLFSSSGTKPT